MFRARDALRSVTKTTGQPGSATLHRDYNQSRPDRGSKSHPLQEQTLALKDILVYVDQTDRAHVRLRLAADLAHRHGSFLTALFVRERDQAQLDERKRAELGLASAEQLQRLDRGIEGAIDSAAGLLRAELEALARGCGIQAEWRSVNGALTNVAPQHARYADLCILGHEVQPGHASIDYGFDEQMLFVGGRPVLFIPPAWSSPTLGRHVAVAWNSSRAAARAVHDALPIIERAERTTVITVNPADFIDRHGALPMEQMVEHLERHGATVHPMRVTKVPPGDIAPTLQSKAREVGADLLVAGAFGQSRLREMLLGGVTNDLLADMRLPILMSQ